MAFDNLTAGVSVTIGTGPIVLSNSLLGYRDIRDVLSNGDVRIFTAVSGANYMVFSGTYATLGTQITVGTIYHSSNSDNAVDWTGEEMQIISTARWEDQFNIDNIIDSASFVRMTPAERAAIILNTAKLGPFSELYQRAKLRGAIFLVISGQSNAVGFHLLAGQTTHEGVYDLTTPNVASPTTYSFQLADPNRASGYVAGQLVSGMRGQGYGNIGFSMACVLQEALQCDVYMVQVAKDAMPITQWDEGQPLDVELYARIADALASSELTTAGITKVDAFIFDQGEYEAYTSVTTPLDGTTPTYWADKAFANMERYLTDWADPNYTMFLYAPLQPDLWPDWDGQDTLNYMTGEWVQVLPFGGDTQMPADGGVHFLGTGLEAIGKGLARQALVGPTSKVKTCRTAITDTMAAPIAAAVDEAVAESTTTTIAALKASQAGTRIQPALINTDGSLSRDNGRPNQNLFVNPSCNVWQYATTRAAGSAGYFADNWFVESTDTAVARVVLPFFNLVAAECTFGASGIVTIGKAVELNKQGEQQPVFPGVVYQWQGLKNDANWTRTYELKVAYRDTAMSTTNEVIVQNWTALTQDPASGYSLNRQIAAFTTPGATNKCLVVLLRISGGTAGQTTSHTSWKLEPGTVRTDCYPPPYSVDLAACQRYYHKEFLTQIGGAADAASRAFQLRFRNPVVMSKTPTVTFSTTGATLTNCTILASGAGNSIESYLSLLSVAAGNIIFIPTGANYYEAKAEL